MTLFPLSRTKDLKFYPRNVSHKFLKVFPADALTSEMEVCLSSHEFAQLTDMRNVFTHRGTPPRQHFFGTRDTETPSAIPGNQVDLASGWRYDFCLDPECLDPYQLFLAKMLRQLVVEASGFARARL